MSEEKTKKGHSVGLSKVVGIALVTLLVGMVLGGFLGLAVIGPELQKLHFGFGNQNDQGNTGDQNNQNSNNPNDNNQNGNQGGTIINNNPLPSNPTGSYGGNGQFDITLTSNGQTFSGTISTNINCQVEQNGNSIQLSMTITPTSVSDSLQQAISIGSAESDRVFNFAGTTSGSQLNANAKGRIGSDNSGMTFDLNLSGTIDQNSLVFTLNSASGSQITMSTPQQITLHPN
jgi:hypothetical protein